MAAAGVRPRRPLSVALLAVLFMAVGALTIAKDLWPPAALASERWSDIGPAWTIRALAIAGGILLWRGVGWARWLLAAWLAFHVAVSAPVWSKLIVHAVLSGVAMYVMFRRPARPFFQGRVSESPHPARGSHS